MASVIDTVAGFNRGKTTPTRHDISKRNNGSGSDENRMTRKKSVSYSTKKIRPSLSVQDISQSTTRDDKKKMIPRRDRSYVANLNNSISKLPSTSDLTSSTKGVSNFSSSSLLGRRSTSTDLLAPGQKKYGGNLTSPAAVASRLSFSSVTKRVSTLLKFRRGFFPGHSGQDKKPPSPPPDPLPAKPRFSAFMSAEAQFALLKGYEDILAEKLVDQFPTEGALIQRTKTPRHSIAISEVGLEHSKPTPWAEKRRSWGGLISKDGGTGPARLGEVTIPVNEGKAGTDSDTNNLDYDTESGGNAIIKVDSAENGMNRKVSSFSQRERADNSPNKQASTSNIAGVLKEDEKATNLSPRGTPQDSTTSFSFHENHVTNSSSQDQPAHSQNLQNFAKDNASHSRTLQARRVSSLPDAVLPPPRGLPRNLTHDRLLMMTHRIEKAMDILDALKPGTELALSPRVKGSNSETDQRHPPKQQPINYRLSERRHSHAVGTEPVRDFNRWTGQWSREFRLNSIN